MTVGSGTVSFQTVRETNLGVVLRTVRELAPCSRSAVASATGLNKTTVSSLVADLMARGLVLETGETSRQRVGRPGVLLALDDSSVAAVGLEVNVDYLSVVAVDLLRNELVGRHVPFDARSAGPEACARRIARTLVETMESPELSGRAVVAAGVAVPGLIDAPAGTVTRAPNLGWQGVRLRDRVGDLLRTAGAGGVPVHVDNDANLAAMAEYRVGSFAGTPDLAYVTGEVGIGAGILAGGELLRGAGGFAGEVGHLALAQDGPECACGRRGCLESLAGIGAIVREAVPDRVPDRPLSGSDVAELVSAAVERAEGGDGVAVGALERAGMWLGRGLSTLVNVTNPSVVLLGGYFVPMGPWLLPGCREEVVANVFAPGAGGCRIELSALGLSAAARGAAASMIHALDVGLLPLPAPGAARAAAVPGGS
ncbi:ROK family transcriptional regulator [Nocardiopsis tropica]|uniref:ROK family transcriptional regulator n=1 Tax=Nocardiopsis tropica TaxID=109330 RepID=A0ABU7KVW5_9ACTN|nr:ROK family transcriptional regulator [Nocardiopsis umidischolae]MEE2053426.1 ROK family transcriptional regulator [Nocardiopsis umidischolae]